MFKQTTLSRAISIPQKLNIAELALLKEESFEVDDRGNAKRQIKFIKLQNNVRFTALSINKVFGCNVELDVNSSQWQEFLKAIKIRNRITHPKGLEEFQISVEESEMIRRVCEWYNDFMMAAIKGIQENLTQKQKNA